MRERPKMEAVISLESNLGSSMPSLVLYIHWSQATLVQWGKKLHIDVLEHQEIGITGSIMEAGYHLFCLAFTECLIFHILFCS